MPETVTSLETPTVVLRRAVVARVPGRDDAGKRVRLGLYPFAPWRTVRRSGGVRLDIERAWGVFEPVLPIVGAGVTALAIVILARFQGPWVIAVLLFSPVATTWIGVAIALTLWTMRAWQRHLSRARAYALHGLGVCPACAYPFPMGSRIEGASPCVCSECGAWWRAGVPGPERRTVVSVRAREDGGSDGTPLATNTE